MAGDEARRRRRSRSTSSRRRRACRAARSASTSRAARCRAPEIRGRVAHYGKHHVERLKLIAQLSDRGLRIDAIGDLMKRIDRGEVDLAEWLGVEEEMQAPWATDQPRTVTEAELYDARRQPPPGPARRSHARADRRAQGRRLLRRQPRAARDRDQARGGRHRSRDRDEGVGDPAQAPRPRGQRARRAVRRSRQGRPARHRRRRQAVRRVPHRRRRRGAPAVRARDGGRAPQAARVGQAGTTLGARSPEEALNLHLECRSATSNCAEPRAATISHAAAIPGGPW